MWAERLRHRLGKLLSKQHCLALTNTVPLLEHRLGNLDRLGLYLHIPFCRQICPYCPYNKEIYDPEVAVRYTNAVIREIDVYAGMVGRKPVTSFYIGGGTPTTMLHTGLDRLLEHVFEAFNMQCDIHLESHPNDLTSDNLNAITSMGVAHLSVGVEALQDHHLQTLHRPYTVEQVKAAIGRAVSKGFKCVNADAIFALPNQTLSEVEELGNGLVELGVDQVAAYPLFEFPYTQWRKTGERNHYRRFSIFEKRRMLSILEQVFRDAGFRRTSVWAFTRRGVPKYCSVTVPLYLGLGASGGSYLRDVFYLNTFNVRAYIDALEGGRLPIALSVDLSEDMQMAGWLYWRIYETRFKKSDFHKRFRRTFDEVYGKYMKLLALVGFLTDYDDDVVCSANGAYWLHLLEDVFSIGYISRLWGTCTQQPWPKSVVLEG